jgi:hypothetical protein
MPIKLTDKKRIDVPLFPKEGLKLARFEIFSVKNLLFIPPCKLELTIRKNNTDIKIIFSSITGYLSRQFLTSATFADYSQNNDGSLVE